MIEQPHILPECFADTLLVNMLIKSTANHKRSITQVFGALKKDFKNRKAIGVIDDDKSKDDYYKEFKIEKDTSNYRYLIHKSKPHYLLVLKKDFERLIFSCAEQTSVKHSYLKDLGTLKRITKSANVHQNNEFKNLLNTLIQKKAPPLLEIQSILLEHLVLRYSKTI